jgi:hypothetical protein
MAICWLALVGGVVIPARGALFAADDAGNYSSWASGDNQGTGFGNWNLSNTSGNSGQNGAFLATSANGNCNILTDGKAWALYANSGQTANAIRPLTGSLSAGQQLLLRFDNNSINSGGSVGFSLQNSSGANRFEFYFVGGQNNYKVNVGGEVDTGRAYTDQGLTLAFTQNGGNGYSFSINGSVAFTGSSGTLAASDISQIRFFNFNAGSGDNFNFYFNDLQVVPEPTSWALLGFGAVAAGAGIRRWWLARQV